MRDVVLRLILMVGVLAATSVVMPSTASANPGYFWIACPYNHSSYDDPIVFPGQQGASPHEHDFFGNTSTDYSSTLTSLLSAATTCTTSTDLAGYWAPTLQLFGGLAVKYGSSAGCAETCNYDDIRAYYSRLPVAGAGITVPPQGMTVVGGNGAATGPQSKNVIDWSCGGSSPFEQYPYDCSGWINLGADQNGVVERVIMPRCWDGTGTAQADFAYPTTGQGGNCPAGYSKVIPLVNIRFHTGIENPCGDGVSCPSGAVNTPLFGFHNADGSTKPWYQAHGDFYDAWQYQTEGGLDDLVTDCLIGTTLACPTNPHTSPGNNMPT